MLLLSSTFALPFKRSRINRASAANNFVGDGTNELATAILQVMYTIWKRDHKFKNGVRFTCIKITYGPQLYWINLLRLAVSLRSTGFNIQKLYMALALRWVFCTDIRTDSDFCFVDNWLAFITVVESVYCAVRNDSLYKADCVSSLKG